MTPSKSKISTQEFQLFAKYIYKLTGIFLGLDKKYLIETRLGSFLKELACSSFTELYKKIVEDKSKKLEKRIIDSITTGETYFFRDKAPFELLQHKIIPDLIDKKRKSNKNLPVNIKIWSAACSTGQEIYSIAIILKELLPSFTGYSIRLMGTDISDEAVARASRGIYNKFEIGRGLDSKLMHKYFKAQGMEWRVKDELRSMVQFRKYNLFSPLNVLGKFDIIFCRNVAIYFSDADKKKIFINLSKVLEPGGSLIIGATESLTAIAPYFKPKRYMRSVFYQLS